MTRRYFLIAALLVAASFAATLIAYPHLPNSVPTHWDVHNHVNGYSPKWALFLIGPGFMAGMIVLFYFLPWLSPKQFEVDTFRSTYLRILLIVTAMLGYFHAVVLWAGLGHAMDVGRAIIGGICLLFALLGNVMGKVRRNFYIGVRTPWALANERVWNATHRFGAKTLVAGGVLGLCLTLAGLVVWWAFVSMMAGVLAPVVYSLVFYKQLERRGQL